MTAATRAALAVWACTFAIPTGALVLYLLDVTTGVGRVEEGLQFSAVWVLAAVAPCVPIGWIVSRSVQRVRGAWSSRGLGAVCLLGAVTGGVAQIISVVAFTMAGELVFPDADRSTTAEAMLGLTYAFPGWPILIPALGAVAGTVLGGLLWQRAAQHEVGAQ